MDIKDAVAIVTGSATGIGAAVARKLASRGCRVVINYSKSEAEARETVGQCREHGVETLLIPEDVAEPIVWLIEGSDHVTGETLMIDAGMHLSFAPLVAR